MTINTCCHVTSTFKWQARIAVMLTVTHSSVVFVSLCCWWVCEVGVIDHCGRITASTKDEANLLECCTFCVLDGWADTSDVQCSVEGYRIWWASHALLSPRGRHFSWKPIPSPSQGSLELQSNFENFRPILARLVASLEVSFNIKGSGGWSVCGESEMTNWIAMRCDTLHAKTQLINI